MSFSRDMWATTAALLSLTIVVFCALCEARFYTNIQVKKVHVLSAAGDVLYMKNVPIQLYWSETDVQPGETFFLVVFNKKVQNFPQESVCRVKTKRCYENSFQGIYPLVYDKDKAPVNLYSWFTREFKPSIISY